ncbi:MAG: ECF transporter S component [Clostridia bacterium]
MNKNKNITVQNKRIRDMAILAMFTAIIFILAFTPIGLIDLPIIKATILHVPVIIGSILLGPKKGALLGFMFGLSSLIKNSIMPSALSFAFSPIIPVPGLTHGSIWAIVICFLPRILVGVTPYFIYKFTNFSFNKFKTQLNVVRIGIAGAIGAFTNTILVMSLIFFVFKDAYATMQSIPVDAVLGVILGIVGANGIPEAIIAAILVPLICIPVQTALKTKSTKIS